MSNTPRTTLDEDEALDAPPETRRIAAALMPLMYDDLRRIARRERMRVRAGGTMQTTALVHEAYLKLQDLPSFNDDQHFLRACALCMRHILVSHARYRMAQKRGGLEAPISLEDAPDVGAASDEDIVKINDALQELAQLNARLAQVVECRFFAGYDDAETALALGMTDRTVRRDWVKARAWLRRALDAGADAALDDAP